MIVFRVSLTLGMSREPIIVIILRYQVTTRILKTCLYSFCWVPKVPEIQHAEGRAVMLLQQHLRLNS